MNKKNILVVLCFSFLCLVSVVSIAAILHDEDEAINVVSIGKNNIEIIEEFTPPDDVVPGDIFLKKPMVKNTGPVPCYVRIFAEFNDNKVADVSSINLNTSKWTEKQSDGYYYYKSILKPGETTEPLFTQVSIDEDAKSEDIQSFDIIVYAESVQSDFYSTYNEAFRSLEHHK